MEGEQKFLIIVVCIALICVTILYGILFYSLWPYRQYVGLSLLAVILLSVVVYLRGRWTEQNLRTMRFRHHDEVPLDERGEPLFYHDTWKPNPHRH